MRKRRFIYHSLCVILVIISVALCFTRFPYALIRLWEGVRDLCLSIGYYFLEVIGVKQTVDPLVTELSDYLPGVIMPEDFNAFKVKVGEYFSLLGNTYNMRLYFGWLGGILTSFAKLLLLILPLVLIIIILVKRERSKQNTDYNKDSKQLRVWKWIENKILKPSWQEIVDYARFCVKNGVYLKILLWVWLINLYYNR